MDKKLDLLAVESENWESFNEFIKSINKKYLLVEKSFKKKGSSKEIKLVPTFLAPFVDPMKFAKITGLDKSSNDNTGNDVISNDPPKKMIAQGVYSIVQKAKKGRKKIIIKQPKEESTAYYPKEKASKLAKEMYYLQYFKENNESDDSPIIKIIGASFCYSNFLNSRLILERGEEDLSDYLKKVGLNFKDVIDVIGKYIECAEAIQFVHSKKIGYLDIKNENFVLIKGAIKVIV